jgi:predicted acylesterase/phospholipase RssA
MWRLQACIALVVVISGCGPLHSRSPLPGHYISKAKVEGYGEIRFWGDTPNTRLIDSIVESWEQERKALNLPPQNTEFPPAAYLAISGGGSDGAFGAGLLNGWTKSGTRPIFKIVTGISTGALIAPFAFLGSETDDALRENYTGIEDKDILIFRGVFQLIRGDSAYDTTPLKKLTKRTLSNKLIDKIAVEHRKGRRLFVGTTNLDAERPVVWDMGAIACSDREDRYDLFRRVLLASAAIPGAFPPIYLDVVAPDGKQYDEMHVDGGVTREMFLLPQQLNLAEVREQHNARRQDVTLYVIRNSRLGPEFSYTTPRVANIAGRSIAVLIKAQSIGDIMILHADATGQGWKFRLAAVPEDIATDSKSMFDRKRMKLLFDRGLEMGQNETAWKTKPPFVEPVEPGEPSTQAATTPQGK